MPVGSYHVQLSNGGLIHHPSSVFPFWHSDLFDKTSDKSERVHSFCVWISILQNPNCHFSLLVSVHVRRLCGFECMLFSLWRTAAVRTSCTYSFNTLWNIFLFQINNKMSSIFILLVWKKMWKFYAIFINEMSLKLTNQLSCRHCHTRNMFNQMFQYMIYIFIGKNEC